MITLIDITLQRGGKLLLQNANLTLHASQKVGLIGANGAGKSSLFALLLQTLVADAGKLQIPPKLRISHLAQEVPALAIAAIDYVLAGDERFADLQQRLQTTENGEELAQLHHEFELIDGYSAKARAAELLHGLGFTAKEQLQPVKDFSGGWRMRLNLARTLMSPADLLLLDEPTNHLDLDAIVWLETWLKSYPGAVIVISHDRDFLDQTVKFIIHLEQAQLKVYSGQYSDFEKQRAAELMLQQATWLKQQQQQQHLQSYIDRFRAKASKARQAQSRIKALARMETVAAVHAHSAFQFEFLEPLAATSPLLKLTHVALGYSEQPLLQQVNLLIANDSRIGLVGPNGAGKSTLMKLLAGFLKPLQGEIIQAKGLKIAYFAQHQLESLHELQSPLQHLQTIAPQASEQALRTFLGSFNFKAEQALAPIQYFSGGEKARLALALLVWQRPNLLLLDEPTNHLDLEMRTSLSIALQSYQGALVIVSHDRHLLRTCTDELYIVANHKVHAFEGDLTDYQQWLSTYRKQQQIPTGESKATNPGQLAYAERKQQRALEAKLLKIEQKLQTLQITLQQLENQLADPALYELTAQAQLAHNQLQHQQLLTEIAATEDAWLQTSAALESL